VVGAEIKRGGELNGRTERRLISTVPMLVLFVFDQRFFIEGLSRGAVKG
jgi:ABC-type maltose transport system permease subunit